MITHIPMQIDADTFLLSTERGRAVAVARAHSRNELELLWIAPEEPRADARAVLEVAGYSPEAPHERVA